MRNHSGHGLAPVAAVDAKVAIRGEKHWIGERFSHAHEAGVGEAHGDVLILLHQPQYLFHLRAELEIEDQSTPPAEQTGEPGGAAPATTRDPPRASPPRLLEQPHHERLEIALLPERPRTLPLLELPRYLEGIRAIGSVGDEPAGVRIQAEHIMPGSRRRTAGA